jgi:hypothetical protein
MTRPLVIYDFAPDSSEYEENFLFFFISKMKKRTSTSNFPQFSIYLISERIISSEVIRFNERPSGDNSAILVLKGEKKI